MDKTQLTITVLNFLFGATGVFGYLATRRAKNADVLKVIQEIYMQFVKDTEYEMGQLKEEVKMLRETVEKVYSNCETKTCKNYILKKNRKTN